MRVGAGRVGHVRDLAVQADQEADAARHVLVRHLCPVGVRDLPVGGLVDRFTKGYSRKEVSKSIGTSGGNVDYALSKMRQLTLRAWERHQSG